MKRVVLSILTAGLASVAAAQSPASQPAAGGPGPGQVVVLNSQRLALESAPGKEAYGRLKKLSDSKKEDLDKLEKDARDLVQKLNDQGSSMPDDKREALAKQADDKQKAWKRAQEDAQRDLQEAERKEMAALESRIGPVVNEFFKEKKYALVLDSRAGIVYRDDLVDVTDEVLKRINTTAALPPAKASSSAPASKAAPTAAGKSSGAPAPKPTPKQ
jgi:Skp family chaperone for outer membrane proteins